MSLTKALLLSMISSHELRDCQSSQMPMPKGRRAYGVIPLDREVPTFSKPTDDKERLDLLRFWKDTTDLQRHEDVVFNNRLQVFLITTSLLLAAFSQFREPKFFILQIGLALFGLAFSFMARGVLHRTSTAIQWYLRVLRRLDVALFNENVRPYQTRRWLTSESLRQGSSADDDKRTTRPTSVLLGIWLPTLVMVLWALILGWSLYNLFGLRCFS